jgi:hypothetical protein
MSLGAFHKPIVLGFSMVPIAGGRTSHRRGIAFLLKWAGPVIWRKEIVKPIYVYSAFVAKFLYCRKNAFKMYSWFCQEIIIICFNSGWIQFWPKVTHAKKRTSHAGCNACDSRFLRVLHRICYSNVAHTKRASCVQHLRGICAGCCSAHAWDAHFWRVCRACVVHSCIVGSARDRGLLLASTVCRGVFI